MAQEDNKHKRAKKLIYSIREAIISDQTYRGLPSLIMTYQIPRTTSPALNFDQKKACESLITLAKYGFTKEQLQTWDGIFYFEHERALCYLCQSGLSPLEAINLVSGTSIAEAEGMAKGLRRYEVAELNTSQIDTLLALRTEGLTNSLLRSWEKSFTGFCRDHQAALIHLVRHRHLTPHAAIAEITHLTSTQAMGIAEGFTRIDVIDLDYNQIRTLITLKDHITASQLRVWRGEDFSREHTKALQYLIMQRKLRPDAAIAEIQELNASEAMGIAHGLTRDEVRGLQEHQVETLIELQERDPLTELKADHLREWRGDFFSYSHKEALTSLIIERHFQPRDAITEINHLKEHEARTLAEKKLTRDEVLGFNGWETQVLQDLKIYGLLPAHLRSIQEHSDDISRWFLHERGKALRYLIKQCRLKPEAAIEVIRGLNDKQALDIALGKTREQVLKDTPLPKDHIMAIHEMKGPATPRMFPPATPADPKEVTNHNILN